MAIVESTTIDGRSRPCVCEHSPPDSTLAEDGGVKQSIEGPSVSSEGTSLMSAPASALTFAARRMTVSYIGSHMPYLRMQGQWLDRAGFRVGSRVRIEVSERRLIVEAVEPEVVLQRSEPTLCHEGARKIPQRRAKRHSLRKVTGAPPWPARTWHRRIEPALAAAFQVILPIERRRERLSTRALAIRAEVNPGRIRGFESASCPLPTISVFIVLAWALDLDPRDLFDEVLRRMNYPYGSRPVLASRAAPDIPRDKADGIPTMSG